MPPAEQIAVQERRADGVDDDHERSIRNSYGVRGRITINRHVRSKYSRIVVKLNTLKSRKYSSSVGWVNKEENEEKESGKRKRNRNRKKNKK